MTDQGTAPLLSQLMADYAATGLPPAYMPKPQEQAAKAEDQLAHKGDRTVGVLTRLQTGLLDFYRELGEIFGVQLSPHNRWQGTRLLRQRWQEHIR